MQLNGTTSVYLIKAVTGLPAGFYSLPISSLNAV